MRFKQLNDDSQTKVDTATVLDKSIITLKHDIVSTAVECAIVLASQHQILFFLWSFLTKDTDI
jgi:hypothetical protein